MSSGFGELNNGIVKKCLGEWETGRDLRGMRMGRVRSNQSPEVFFLGGGGGAEEAEQGVYEVELEEVKANST